MAIQTILTYPDRRLKQISLPVETMTEQIRSLITDLTDTFTAAPGCVGIAAPQIGVLQRVIIVDVTRSASKKAKKDSSIHGNLICINPQIVESQGSIMFREGCLSVPDFTGNVVRSQSVTVSFRDEKFEERTISADGFEAIVLQHEIDHLNGVLFLDNVRSFKRDVFRRVKYQ